MLKRPMTALFAAWALGLLARAFPLYVAAVAVGLYILFFLLFLWISDIRKEAFSRFVTSNWYKEFLILIISLPVLFVVSYARGRIYDTRILEERNPYREMYEAGEKDCVITGYISDISSDAEKITIRLRLEKGGCLVYLYLNVLEEAPQIANGDTVKVYGNFRYFDEAQNPGQFDAQSYYERDRTYFSITARSIWVVKEASRYDLYAKLKNASNVVKSRVKEGIKSGFNDKQAGIISAMLLGEKSGLDTETKEMYRKAGISHILAISGLHISLICLGVYEIMKKLTFPYVLRHVITFAVIISYVWFSGMSTSAIRAGIMTAILLLGRLLRKRYDMLSGLMLSGMIITCIFPNEIRGATFLLSFTAVLGICVAQEIGAELFTGAIITVMTLPVTCYFFFEFSPYTVIANIIILPFMGVLMGTGMLTCLFGLLKLPFISRLCAGVPFLILQGFEGTAVLLGKLPFSYVLAGRPEAWQVILYYLVVFGSLKAIKDPEKKWKRGITIFLLLVLVVGSVVRKEFRKPNITFLSVGQGDCSVYISSKDSVVFDCGSSDLKQVGKYVLVPFLKCNGISVVDSITLSHYDNDHISGIVELLEAMDSYETEFDYLMGYSGNVGIKEIVLPEMSVENEKRKEIERLAKAKNVKISYFKAGDRLEIKEKNTEICCISPDNEAREILTDGNDASLVFYLKTSDFQVMLQGDAGVEAEKYMLNSNYLPRISEDIPLILKAGHHGSRTATSKEWVEYLNPRITILSFGKNNTYGHPHEEVLEILEECGTEIRRTVDGYIVIP